MQAQVSLGNAASSAIARISGQQQDLQDMQSRMVETVTTQGVESVTRMSNLLKETLGQNKLDQGLFKELMTLSTTLRDRVDKCLRLVAKSEQLGKHLATWGSGRWPNGAPTFRSPKETLELVSKLPEGFEGFSVTFTAED
eukprot:9238587-Karenia_brevis.AAC.1